MQKDKRKKTALAPKVACVAAVFIVVTLYLFFSKNHKAESQNNVIKIDALELNIEVADSGEERIRGLSNRNSLSSDSGMLFTFESVDEYCFWMKDMNFAIDMIWIGEDQKITHIQKNVTPGTYPVTFCNSGKYVLEINSGLSDKYGLQNGQTAQIVLDSL
ncbi:DUF192 domain-containing protein [Candidatus Saccharibacteria bacterium CPR2]|nr:DUF192 domain-containing protein [Candidatus Saccharibacteria bacterium CPR2]